MTTTLKRRRKDNRPNLALDRVVMGVDQSYSGFGVCILTPDGTYVMHRGTFDAQRYGKGVDRLCAMGEWFRKIIYDTPQQIEHVCIEGYAHGAKFGREQAGELGAVVKLALRLHPRLWNPSCYPTIVAPTQVKQFAASSGSAKKEDMKLNVYKRWGVEFKTNDEADAYVLARIAAGIRSHSDTENAALLWAHGELTGYQNDLIAKLRQHTER
jgi:Holliday junction resolvasome RuvABC endonuclease subunit